MGPILVINHGPIQVAITSNATETVLAMATCVEVYPDDRRYVTICPEKDKTVK